MTTVLRGKLVPLSGVPETRDSDDWPVYIATVVLTASLHVLKSDPGNLFTDISMWLFHLILNRK